VGIESTIIDCTGSVPRVLRPGAITEKMIEQATNKQVEKIDSISGIKVPGLMISHYAPSAQIILNSNAEMGEGFIALAEIPTPIGAIRLISPKSIEEFAKVLYSAFRYADKIGLRKIFIIPPLGVGLEKAIMDRVLKASQTNKN
jgi:L-threonylcarbamoyladenylate synthase